MLMKERTRDLLQRHDDSTPTNTPVISRTLPGQNAPGQPSTPIRQPVPQHPNLGQSSGVNPRLARTPSLPSCTCPFFDSLVEVMSPPFAATPLRKRWYDKRANKLLGDDEQYNVSPSSRYALICEKCIAHNGLVKACGRMRVCIPLFAPMKVSRSSHISARTNTGSPLSYRTLSPSTCEATDVDHPGSSTFFQRRLPHIFTTSFIRRLTPLPPVHFLGSTPAFLSERLWTL